MRRHEGETFPEIIICRFLNRFSHRRHRCRETWLDHQSRKRRSEQLELSKGTDGEGFCVTLRQTVFLYYYTEWLVGVILWIWAIGGSAAPYSDTSLWDSTIPHPKNANNGRYRQNLCQILVIFRAREEKQSRTVLCYSSSPPPSPFHFFVP